MNQGVSTRSSLDLTEANKIASLEISIAMLEFPECCIRVSGVKYVPLFMETVHIQLSYERRNVGVFKIL